jgi:hypothetical protein
MVKFKESKMDKFFLVMVALLGLLFIVGSFADYDLGQRCEDAGGVYVQSKCIVSTAIIADF